jgi:O-antigen/teichoic acid export membrane protein
VLVIINFTVAGVGFLTTIKIANTLGKETFGLLAYGLAIGAYGGAFIRFGQDRTLVRDLIHYPEQFGSLVAASLLLRWICFGVVVAALFAWKLGNIHSSDITWSALIVIIANILMSMDLQPVYDSWHKQSRHAIYNLIQRVLYFLIIWAMIIFAPQNLSIFWIGVASLFSVVLYLVLQHRWAIKRIDIGSDYVLVGAMALKMARGNITLLLAAFGCLSFGNLNQLVLKHYCGIAELGSYAAAWQIACIAILLLTQIARIGNPAMARVTKQGMPKNKKLCFLLKYSFIMLFAVLPIAVMLVVSPEFILTSIFKPEYATAASSLRVFGVYLLVFSLGIIASQYVVSSGMEWLYFSSVVLGTMLSVVLCLTLVPRLGGVGAAISLLAAHGIAIGMYWVVMIRHIKRTSLVNK